MQLCVAMYSPEDVAYVLMDEITVEDRALYLHCLFNSNGTTWKDTLRSLLQVEPIAYASDARVVSCGQDVYILASILDRMDACQGEVECMEFYWSTACSHSVRA